MVYAKMTDLKSKGHRMAAAFERQPWSWRPMPPRTQLVQVDKFRFPTLHALLDLNKADMG